MVTLKQRMLWWQAGTGCFSQTLLVLNLHTYLKTTLQISTTSSTRPGGERATLHRRDLWMAVCFPQKVTRQLRLWISPAIARGPGENSSSPWTSSQLVFITITSFLVCLNQCIMTYFSNILPFYFILIGCVIAELFTEGVPLFDLSQLLAYRKGHFQTEQVLMKIEDHSIRELVAFLFIWDFRYFVLFHVRFYKCLHSTIQKCGVGRLFCKFLKILWSLLCSLRLLFLDQKCSNIVIILFCYFKTKCIHVMAKSSFQQQQVF